MTVARVSQILTETLETFDVSAKTSQAFVESLETWDTNSYVSQEFVEVLIQNPKYIHLSKIRFRAWQQ